MPPTRSLCQLGWKTAARNDGGLPAIPMDPMVDGWRGDPLQADTPLRYEFALPNASHVFRVGHRIMVQIQSSWFPLYDRNPQTFVPNIFFAQPADYVAATQKVTVSGPEASFISLPIVQQP